MKVIGSFFSAIQMTIEIKVIENGDLVQLKMYQPANNFIFITKHWRRKLNNARELFSRRLFSFTRAMPTTHSTTVEFPKFGRRLFLSLASSLDLLSAAGEWVKLSQSINLQAAENYTSAWSSSSSSSNSFFLSALLSHLKQSVLFQCVVCI